MAANNAQPNRCPPGGEDGARRLAAALGTEYLPLDPSCGTPTAPARAVIDESRCIGCTLCIKACPVDAIVGAAKRMHTVIVGDCTGCALCLPPCPVDCISMVVRRPAPDTTRLATDAVRWRALYERRERRLAAVRITRQRAAVARAAEHKRAAVARAIETAQRRLAKKSAGD